MVGSVRRCRADDLHQPQAAQSALFLSFAGLSGGCHDIPTSRFAGRCMCGRCSSYIGARAGRHHHRAIGGVVVAFKPGFRHGGTFVDIAVIRLNGELRG